MLRSLAIALIISCGQAASLYPEHPSPGVAARHLERANDKKAAEQQSKDQKKAARKLASKVRKDTKAAQNKEAHVQRTRRRLQYDGPGSIANGVCLEVTVTNDAEAAEAVKCTTAVGQFTIQGTFTKHWASQLINIDSSLLCNLGCEHWSWPELESIEGLVVTADASLTRWVDKLPKLDTINDADLEISGCDNLEEIDDFEKLTHINMDINIGALPKLKRIAGFDDLVAMGDDFMIYDNMLLEEIPKFDSLITIGYQLWLSNLPSLEIIEGFDKMTSCIWGFAIVNTGAMEIKGFDSWVTQDDELIISSNPRLRMIDGFNGIGFFYDDIQIDDNPELREIKGFDNEGMWGWGNIYIRDNAKLKSIEGFNKGTFFNGVYILRNEKLENIKIGEQLRSTYTIQLDGNVGLKRIEGFKHLKEPGNIQIFDSPNLGEIDELKSLVGIQSTLELENVGLHDVEFLSNLRTVGDGFSIVDMPNLISLGGLEKLSFIGNQNSGTTSILGNPKLRDLDGFNGVSTGANSQHPEDNSFAFKLSVSDNGHLHDLDGIAGLDTLYSVEFGDTRYVGRRRGSCRDIDDDQEQYLLKFYVQGQKEERNVFDGFASSHCNERRYGENGKDMDSETVEEGFVGKTILSQGKFMLDNGASYETSGENTILQSGFLRE